MDKNQFATILKHYSGSSVEEAQEVLSLKGLFPYCQMLHVLSARVSKDHGFSNQQNELQLAAVYAADRMVLKEIITQDSSVSDQEIAAPVVIATPVVTKPVEKEIKKADSTIPTVKPQTTTQSKVVTPQEEINNDGDVADTLMHDLDRLSELKHNFEALFIDQPDVKLNPIHTESPVIAKPEPIHHDSSKSKKQRIIELARSLQAEKEVVKPAEQVVHKKKENPVEKLIEEIKTSKKEIKPEGEKQKEQIQIIDQFIKIQPSITNVKERTQPAPAGDLATTKTGEFGENIVSETLVELLIKQGKKDKAIEVLKKLIWKFPQKKAFFAAQIEDLKK